MTGEVLANLFPTVWKPEEQRYRICEMRSWGYAGPLEDPENPTYELEIACTADRHPVVELILSEMKPAHAWVRILGYESQGLQGAQRNPQALLIAFGSSAEREEFNRRWEASK